MMLREIDFLQTIHRFLFAISGSSGSTKNGRDSVSKRLGVKIFGGQKIKIGQIIVTQQGKKFKTATGDGNVRLCKNFSIKSKINGYVKFFWKKKQCFVTVVAGGSPRVAPSNNHRAPTHGKKKTRKHLSDYMFAKIQR